MYNYILKVNTYGMNTCCRFDSTSKTLSFNLDYLCPQTYHYQINTDYTVGRIFPRKMKAQFRAQRKHCLSLCHQNRNLNVFFLIAVHR